METTPTTSLKRPTRRVTRRVDQSSTSNIIPSNPSNQNKLQPSSDLPPHSSNVMSESKGPDVVKPQKTQPPLKKAAHKNTPTSIGRKSGSALKKKPSTTQIPAHEAKALLENAAQKRKKQKKIFMLQTQLSETRKCSTTQLREAANLLLQSHYQDVALERALTQICGYPLCDNAIGNYQEALSGKQYKIDAKKKVVYGITELAKFCCEECLIASRFYEEQLDQQEELSSYMLANLTRDRVIPIKFYQRKQDPPTINQPPRVTPESTLEIQTNQPIEIIEKNPDQMTHPDFEKFQSVDDDPFDHLSEDLTSLNLQQAEKQTPHFKQEEKLQTKKSNLKETVQQTKKSNLKETIQQTKKLNLKEEKIEKLNLKTSNSHPDISNLNKPNFTENLKEPSKEKKPHDSTESEDDSDEDFEMPFESGLDTMPLNSHRIDQTQPQLSPFGLLYSTLSDLCTISTKYLIKNNFKPPPSLSLPKTEILSPAEEEIRNQLLPRQQVPLSDSGKKRKEVFERQISNQLPLVCTRSGISNLIGVNKYVSALIDTFQFPNPLSAAGSESFWEIICFIFLFLIAESNHEFKKSLNDKIVQKAITFYRLDPYQFNLFIDIFKED